MPSPPFFYGLVGFYSLSDSRVVPVFEIRNLMYANALGLLERDIIPLQTPSWSCVLPQQEAAIVSGIHSSFDFVTRDEETSEFVPPTVADLAEIDVVILQNAKKRLRDAKSRLSRYFRVTCGGDRAFAETNKPKNVSEHDWKAILDLMETPEFKVSF